jgi:preprotein translocase subunit SecG
MSIVFTVIIVLVCLLLAVVVLIQNPKGGGLDSTFGSAAQLGGVKKTTDFLEKSTWTLAITLMVLCLGSAAFINSDASNTVDEKFRDEAPIQQNQPTLQAQPAAQPQAQPAGDSAK